MEDIQITETKNVKMDNYKHLMGKLKSCVGQLRDLKISMDVESLKQNRELNFKENLDVDFDLLKIDYKKLQTYFDIKEEELNFNPEKYKIYREVLELA